MCFDVNQGTDIENDWEILFKSTHLSSLETLVQMHPYWHIQQEGDANPIGSYDRQYLEIFTAYQ